MENAQRQVEEPGDSQTPKGELLEKVIKRSRPNLKKQLLWQIIYCYIIVTSLSSCLSEMDVAGCPRHDSGVVPPIAQFCLMFPADVFLGGYQ